MDETLRQWTLRRLNLAAGIIGVLLLIASALIVIDQVHAFRDGVSHSECASPGGWQAAQTCPNIP